MPLSKLLKFDLECKKSNHKIAFRARKASGTFKKPAPVPDFADNRRLHGGGVFVHGPPHIQSSVKFRPLITFLISAVQEPINRLLKQCQCIFAK